MASSIVYFVSRLLPVRLARELVEDGVIRVARGHVTQERIAGVHGLRGQVAVLVVPVGGEAVLAVRLRFLEDVGGGPRQRGLAGFRRALGLVDLQGRAVAVQDVARPRPPRVGDARLPAQRGERVREVVGELRGLRPFRELDDPLDELFLLHEEEEAGILAGEGVLLDVVVEPRDVVVGVAGLHHLVAIALIVHRVRVRADAVLGRRSSDVGPRPGRGLQVAFVVVAVRDHDPEGDAAREGLDRLHPVQPLRAHVRDPQLAYRRCAALELGHLLDAAPPVVGQRIRSPCGSCT